MIRPLGSNTSPTDVTGAGWLPRPAAPQVLLASALERIGALSHFDPATADLEALREAARIARALAFDLGGLASAKEVEALAALPPGPLPPATPEQTAGARIRALREALGLSRDELTDVAGVAVRPLEVGEPRARRVVRCVAEALAELSEGRLDADELEADLSGRMERDDLVSRPTNHSGLPDREDLEAWVARKRRHARPADVVVGALRQRRLAARLAVAEGRE